MHRGRERSTFEQPVLELRQFWALNLVRTRRHLA